MTANLVRKIKKFDATGQTVGRLATQIALALRGKDEPEWQPHLDTGAMVEVSNIAKLKFTGKKLQQKVYHHYSGHPSGIRTKTMGEMFANKPGEILWRAVRKMLPDNRLRNGMLKRLIIK
jgi:large subunit ribosomal protein L13